MAELSKACDAALSKVSVGHDKRWAKDAIKELRDFKYDEHANRLQAKLDIVLDCERIASVNFTKASRSEFEPVLKKLAEHDIILTSRIKHAWLGRFCDDMTSLRGKDHFEKFLTCILSYPAVTLGQDTSFNFAQPANHADDGSAKDKALFFKTRWLSFLLALVDKDDEEIHHCKSFCKITSEFLDANPPPEGDDSHDDAMDYVLVVTDGMLQLLQMRSAGDQLKELVASRKLKGQERSAHKFYSVANAIQQSPSYESLYNDYVGLAPLLDSGSRASTH
jgi:hypothetical protein